MPQVETFPAIGWLAGPMLELHKLLITTGQVHRGSIEVENSSLPEGTKVTILVHEDDETFELSAEDEANLLAAVAEAEKGDAWQGLT